MKYLSVWVVVFLLGFSSLSCASDEFSSSKFAAFKQQHQGKQWLVLLWSLDCPPCFKELKIIGQLNAQRSDLPVVLINTDDQAGLTEAREKVIEKYGLSQLTQWHFADDGAAKARFVIDPSWYGELPRSYFYRADGSRVGRSGLVDATLLKSWLLL